MSAAPKLKYTPEQYLELERKAVYKSQYFNGEIFAMAGASGEHVRINANFTIAAGSAFGEGPCYLLPNDLKVKVEDTGLYTYPDNIILCEDMEIEDDHGDVLLNPKIIVEVLSASTERYDRGRKFQQYKRISSLHEYILISQDAPHIDRFHRQVDDDWNLKTFSGLDASFTFATIPVTIALAAIYRGVTFIPEDPVETQRLMARRGDD